MELNNKKEDKKVSIVLIDSGIDSSISDLKKYISSQTEVIVGTDSKITEVDFTNVKQYHGTSVALTIRHVCKNIDFTGINILNEGGCTDTRILLYAMYKAVNMKPDIIHMSLGTENNNYISYFNEILDLAYENGTIVVTALENHGKLSYPSCLDKSISVTYGNFANNDILLKNGKDYVAPYKAVGVNDVEKVNIIAEGSSISAAFVTGIIANILLGNPGITIAKVTKLLDEKVANSIRSLVSSS